MNTKKNIYFLEDDPDIQELVRNILTSEGYLVSVFGTVHAFNRRVLECLPDLFIVDISLPDGSGLNVTEHLAAHRTGPVPPIIVMSADIVNGKNAVLSGARHFLSKPFSEQELRSTIKRLLVA